MNVRIGSVTAAMTAIAGLTVLLGVEAVRAARAQRATVERVLTDYAGLGAEGVGTRLQPYVAGTLFPILNQVRDPLPATAKVLSRDLNANQAALAEEVLWVGRVTSVGPSRMVQFDASLSVDAPLTDSVFAAAYRLNEQAYFGLLSYHDQLIAFTPLRGSPAVTTAFGLPIDVVAPWLSTFLARDRLLPAAILPSAPLADRIGVELSIGGVVIARRETGDSSRFKGVHQMGAVYGGMTVEVQLMEELAASLVIGGLPPSRLPFLAVMMLLAGALAIVAIWQVRQRDRLTRLREDFVTSASHELRTPLAQMRLFAETLRLGRVRSDDEKNHAVGVIEREVRRLEHLVDNLLNASRAQHDALPASIQSVDLAALTCEAVSEYTPLAAKSGVTIHIDAPQSIASRLDPAAWRHIVINLLDNATKYGPREGRVDVSLTSDGRFSRLTITDQGPGVATADADRIWERFWRGAQVRSAGVTGTGVGLATVKHLVELMGGKCWVEQATPTGARFVVRTPITT